MKLLRIYMRIYNSYTRRRIGEGTSGLESTRCRQPIVRYL